MRTLKLFLDLVNRQDLLSCSAEVTLGPTDGWSQPRHSTHSFATSEELESFLGQLFTQGTSSLLSLTFYYEKNVRMVLDVLMNHLYLRNSIMLVQLEKLSNANLIGSGKLIEEIRMEFAEEDWTDKRLHS